MMFCPLRRSCLQQFSEINFRVTSPNIAKIIGPKSIVSGIMMNAGDIDNFVVPQAFLSLAMVRSMIPFRDPLKASFSNSLFNLLNTLSPTEVDTYQPCGVPFAPAIEDASARTNNFVHACRTLISYSTSGWMNG